jgi:hypothetical protein
VGLDRSLDCHANISSCGGWLHDHAEHDPERPWIIRGRHRRVELADDIELTRRFARSHATTPPQNSKALQVREIVACPVRFCQLLSKLGQVRARQDLNLRPSAPEADALSPELRAL